MKNQIKDNDSKLDIATRLITSGIHDEAIKVIQESLGATVHVRGIGFVPDNQTRLKAGTLILSYSAGLPPRRFEILQANIDATKAGMGNKDEEIEMTWATVEAMEEAIRSFKLTKLENQRGAPITPV